MLPSGWSCLSLVQRLTLEVERSRFREALAGELTVAATVAADHDAWVLGSDASAAGVVGRDRREIEAGDG